MLCMDVDSVRCVELVDDELLVDEMPIPAETMGLGDCGQPPPPPELFDDEGLFFHGWNPFPTAASANGGGDLLDSLLHCAANIANGVPRRLGCS